MDGERTRFPGGPLSPSFRRKIITVEPGERRPYDESEWQDALVAVESGEIVLEFRSGACRTFGSGDLLWLIGMGVLSLHNAGAESVVLVAVSRR